MIRVVRDSLAEGEVQVYPRDQDIRVSVTAGDRVRGAFLISGYQAVAPDTIGAPPLSPRVGARREGSKARRCARPIPASSR